MLSCGRTRKMETTQMRRTQAGRSSVVLHGALALLAVAGAYLTWTRDRAPVAAGEVAALSAGKRDVQSVTYRDPSRSVTVDRRLDGAGQAYAWVTITSKTKD